MGCSSTDLGLHTVIASSAATSAHTGIRTRASAVVPTARVPGRAVRACKCHSASGIARREVGTVVAKARVYACNDFCHMSKV